MNLWHRFVHWTGWAPSILHRVNDDGSIVLMCATCGKFTILPASRRRGSAPK